MLFASFLVLVASEKCLLSQAGVYDLGSRTFSFFTDVTSVVAKGLQIEAVKLAGPEHSKMISGQVDLALIEYGKIMKQADPFIAEAMAMYSGVSDKATAAVYPYIEMTNAALDGPLREFAQKLPAHKELLTAPTLIDKILLLGWFVIALTFVLRIMSLALSLTFGIFFKIVCCPCRLCSKREAATKKKGKFAGSSQASNGNGKTAPPPKKK
jgi:hypothetical protein